MSDLRAHSTAHHVVWEMRTVHCASRGDAAFAAASGSSSVALGKAATIAAHFALKFSNFCGSRVFGVQLPLNPPPEILI